MWRAFKSDCSVFWLIAANFIKSNNKTSKQKTTFNKQLQRNTHIFISFALFELRFDLTAHIAHVAIADSRWKRFVSITISPISNGPIINFEFQLFILYIMWNACSKQTLVFQLTTKISERKNKRLNNIWQINCNDFSEIALGPTDEIDEIHLAVPRNQAHSIAFVCRVCILTFSQFIIYSELNSLGRMRFKHVLQI